MQRRGRHRKLFGKRTVAAAADADLLQVLAHVRVTAPASSAHAITQHGVPSDPFADPGAVDTLPDSRDRARPLVAEPNRIPGVALFEIGHLAGEELGVRAAHTDA